MILKVFSVLQLIFIQVISAQLSNRELASQNGLNDLADTLQEEYGRYGRQINTPAVDLPINGFAKSLPFGNGDFPCGNGVPNNVGLNNGLINNLALNSGLTNNLELNNGLTNNLALNNGLPNNLRFNNGLPNNLPINNGLVNNLALNNGLPNNLVQNNQLPNNLAFNNGLPNNFGLNKGLPNNFAMDNGNTFPNNSPFNAPFPNIPQNRPIPNINAINNNGLPFNNIPNEFPNINNLPSNKFLNMNNGPAGNNILNLNNLPATNSLPNINGIPNGAPSFNNLPFGNALPLPLNNGLPSNNFPNGNILSSLSNRPPFLNNIPNTKVVFDNGVNRFFQNNLPDGIVLSSANNLQNDNILTQKTFDEVTNNEFTGISNSPNGLSHIVPVYNKYLNSNNSPLDAKSMQLNIGFPNAGNFKNYNVIANNEQRFFNNIGGEVFNNFPANTKIPNPNSRLVNAINHGMPLSNGGYLNDILFSNNDVAVNMPEQYMQNGDGKRFYNNNFQFGNVQTPVNNWQYDFKEMNMPANQDFISGVPKNMFLNTPNNYQPALTSNNLNLAQELVKNLKIEGLANVPFLNGLPVAGITETVTVLNGPCSK